MAETGSIILAIDNWEVFNLDNNNQEKITVNTFCILGNQNYQEII